MSRASRRRRLSRLGVVFQARTLDLDLTVMQNLLYHASLHGIGGREGRALADETLARTEMRERAHEKARVLSGGQMRRIEIARALLHRPSLLLLDEPTVGLDINARKSILSYVRGLVAHENIGVLWTTHLIDEVAQRRRSHRPASRACVGERHCRRTCS